MIKRKKELSKMEELITKGHLTKNERDLITIFHAQGLSIRRIAKELKRNPSTISRELNRKEAVFFRGKYVGSQTHGNVKRNWINSHAKKKLDNKQIRKYVEVCLKLGFSPLTIAGRLREKYGFKIHHETIYQYIFKERTDLTKYLLRSKVFKDLMTVSLNPSFYLIMNQITKQDDMVKMFSLSIKACQQDRHRQVVLYPQEYLVV
jgi:transposase, IS30 family